MNKKTSLHFSLIFIYIVTSLFIAVILWSIFSTKTYVVKASGVVTDQYKENIMNYSTGEIKKIYVKEGDKVSKGDKIIEIDSFQTNLQIRQIEELVLYYQNKVNNINKVINFVNGFTLDDEESQINPFDENDTSTSKEYSNCKYFIDVINQQKEQAESNTDEEGNKQEYKQSDVDNIKFNFLQQMNVYSELDNYNTNLIQQESQLKMYKDSLNSFIITATRDGIIHLTNGLTIGTTLSQPTLLGSISSDDNLIIQASLSSSDISKVNIDDEVEIALSGVNQSEFGVIKGKLIEIDKDISSDNNGNTFYMCKVKPSSNKLNNRKDKEIYITSGMISECRIKYDDTSYFIWAIEQIGVKLR